MTELLIFTALILATSTGVEIAMISDARGCNFCDNGLASMFCAVNAVCVVFMLVACVETWYWKREALRAAK